MAPAATVPPVNEIIPEEATAVTVPPQVLVTLGTISTRTPAGKLSMKLNPLAANALAELSMVNNN